MSKLWVVKWSCLFFACGTNFDKFVFIYVSDKNMPTDFECLLRFSTYIWRVKMGPLFVLVSTVKFQLTPLFAAPKAELTDTLENIRYLFEINAAIMA
jgi:hypothetical protein